MWSSLFRRSTFFSSIYYCINYWIIITIELIVCLMIYHNGNLLRLLLMNAPHGNFFSLYCRKIILIIGQVQLVEMKWNDWAWLPVLLSLSVMAIYSMSRSEGINSGNSLKAVRLHLVLFRMYQLWNMSRILCMTFTWLNDHI